MTTLLTPQSLSTKEMEFLIEKYYTLIEDMEDAIAIAKYRKKEVSGTQKYLRQEDQDALMSSLLS